MQITRTSSDNPNFQALVVLLDQELRVRDGEDHAFYAQFNKTDSIKEVVVAYLDGQPVGCGAFKPWQDDIAEIKRMYVKTEFRGRGIAASIVLELEQWAASLNYTACVLETGMNQPEAIALYKKSGYNIIPNYGQYVGVDNSVCMQKTLSSIYIS